MGSVVVVQVFCSASFSRPTADFLIFTTGDFVDKCVQVGKFISLCLFGNFELLQDSTLLLVFSLFIKLSLFIEVK